MPHELAKPVGPIRNISDTARWVAYYRARETERPDAIFRDPFAARLAGERGKEIADGFSFSARHAWAYVARTYLIDQFISEQVRQGADMVVNLAAGLDTRPYRMELPTGLKWIEVDLPELLDYKDDVLRDAKAKCAVEKIRLDLSNVSARRQLYAELGERAKKVVVLTEGLLIYLSAEDVAAFSADLAGPASFRYWIIDLVSPGLLQLLQKGMGAQLSAAGAPLIFGPEAGTGFFDPYGWKAVDVRSLLKAAARLGRLSFWMRMAALLPESKRPPGSRPWSGICLMEKI